MEDYIEENDIKSVVDPHYKILYSRYPVDRHTQSNRSKFLQPPKWKNIMRAIKVTAHIN